jgi:hypothetical protein
MGAADDVCKSCGAVVQKMNRNWSKFAKISVITLIIAAFGTYILLYNLGVVSPDTFGDIFGSPAMPDEPTTLDVSYMGQGPEEAAGEDGEIAAERPSSEEKQAALASVLEAADAYVRDFSQFNPIISRMGYLHNASLGEYVTVELLERLGLLDENRLTEDVFILYLRPMDLVQFDEFVLESALSAGQMVSLAVFVAHEVPTGIGLYSHFGEQLIFRENLNRLLLYEYNPDNGEIIRPTAQDAVYHAVVEMISDAHPGADVFIRYLAADDAHGFAAFSLTANGNGVINHIFALEYENYELMGVRLLAAGLEVTQHPKADINQAAPNFNFDLMPNYDITGVSLLPGNSPVFNDILGAMIQNGQLEEGHSPIFMSATANFAYIVRAYGDVFFGRHDDGWEIAPIDGWRAAEALMAEITNNPPLYIIWQQ